MTTTTTEASGTFQADRWEETLVAELEGAPKLTRATWVNHYGGDIEGDGTVQSVTGAPWSGRLPEWRGQPMPPRCPRTIAIVG